MDAQAHNRLPNPAALRIDDTRRLLQCVPAQRRLLHAGDKLYRAGDHFNHLYVLTSGLMKVVNLSRDGREQLVCLNLRGDWLGLDGIATGRHGADVIAVDTSEVWAFGYENLLAACVRAPELLRALHEAMSREITRDRNAMLSRCTLAADARVADFLFNWAQSLEARGMRGDQITLSVTRAEIGNLLGMTLESVSRALSRLSRLGLIAFDERGRRDIRIPRIDALTDFIEGTPAATVALAGRAPTLAATAPRKALAPRQPTPPSALPSTSSRPARAATWHAGGAYAVARA